MGKSEDDRAFALETPRLIGQNTYRMPSRSKAKNRCPRCLMREVLCLCPALRPRMVSTRFTVIMHWREVPRTTNSAKLATLMLPNSAIRVRGYHGIPFDAAPLISDPGYEHVILFPSDDAADLEPPLPSKPMHLLVPDGNWKQAHKVLTREPRLNGLRRVKLPSGDAPSRYHPLRASPHPERISTFEAIARAVGLLEGNEIRVEMESAFQLMVTRTLWSRGKIPLAECLDSIPEAAVRAFREDGARGSRKPSPKLV